MKWVVNRVIIKCSVNDEREDERGWGKGGVQTSFPGEWNGNVFFSSECVRVSSLSFVLLVMLIFVLEFTFHQ